MFAARALGLSLLVAAIALTGFVPAQAIAVDPGAGLPLFRRPATTPAKAPSVAPAKPQVGATPGAQPNVTSDQTSGAEVDVDEVARRGDRVVVAGRGPMSTDDLVIGDALAPPADDSHKWFFSVIVDESKESQALLYDLKHSPHLRSWAKIDDQTQSWSHVTVYVAKDQTQDWRWAKLRISRYPVMILQPPAKRINEGAANAGWEWGDPKTVVWQWDGYDATQPERAKLRAESIRRAMLSYVQKVAQSRQSTRQSVTAPTPGPRAAPGAGQLAGEVGATPFPLPVLPTIPGGNPVFPSDPTSVPSTPAQAPDGIVDLASALVGKFLGPKTAGFWLALLAGLKIWELIAKRTKSQLDDQAVAFVRSIADQLNPIKIDPPK